MSKILVIGDSQCQGAGKYLVAYFRDNGNTVTHESKASASASAVVSLASKYNKTKFDQVVIFAGGNGSPSIGDVQGFLALFPDTQVDWIGPPPATKILDLGLSRTVFGGKVDNANFWFQDGTADKREVNNDFLSVAVTESGATYHDWRKWGLGGEKQASGVTFPNQPDGIHVSVATAQKAFERGIPSTLIAESGLFSLSILAVIGLAYLAVKK